MSESWFDIVLLDLTTGDTRIVAKDAVSLDAPAIRWNQASTHILVAWPARYGI